MSQGAAIGDEAELLFTIRQQLEDHELLKTTSEIAATFVSERVGATLAILSKVYLKQGSSIPHEQ